MSNDRTSPSDQRWSSRSIAASWQHNFFYVLIKLGGRRLAYAFLYPVVAYYILFRPSLRKRTSFYLFHRFPGIRGAKLLLASFRQSLSFARVLVDRATLGIVGPESFDVAFHGQESLNRLFSDDRGFILLTSHVGCWQVAMSGVSWFDTTVHMLMQREDGDVDRHYFEHRGMEMPFRIIDPRGFLGGTLEVLQALKNGDVVSIMGDRVFGHEKNGIYVDFLGEPALFPFSPYKLASELQVPVVVFFTYKTGPKSYVLELARIIEVEPGLGRPKENFAPYVRQYVEVLESYVQEHPYQFFNFFNMWS